MTIHKRCIVMQHEPAGHVGIARVLKIGGETVAVAGRRSGRWSTTDIET